MDILQVTQVSDELVEAFQRLIPQLSQACAPPTRDELCAIVAAPGTVLLIARDREHANGIVGTITLILYRVPTGVRAWFEDLVVDHAAQHRGIATSLFRVGIERAIAAGATRIDLTCKPSREEAHRLYPRLGFRQRNTLVYRYDLTQATNASANT